MSQLAFDLPVTGSEIPPGPRERAGAFVDNMSRPIHRWFRYSAGFSADWCRREIESAGLTRDDLLLDPFVGSGTALLAARDAGVPSLGIENHPFVLRIARAKLTLDVDPDEFHERAIALARRATREIRTEDEADAGLLSRCYTPDSLARLTALRREYEREFDDGDPFGELFRLAITSILRECSGVGTAQWQYVLPNKSKARVREPFAAFEARCEMMREDLRFARERTANANARVILGDARDPRGPDDLHGRVAGVVTSPPYPNNYDYADATRLEMTFWGEVSRWGDLHTAVRNRLVRSCSQHASADKLNLDTLLADPALGPILDEITPVCRELEALRETRAGHKTYHTMVAAYFIDLARVWGSLRAMCRDGAPVVFVIGDAAPYGVHIPVERWLGRIAVARGFSRYAFEKIRDRNTKWRNRKHSVPLQEGYLRVEA